MYIFRYNHDWPKQFQNQANLLAKLSPIELELHHIGSTAVPGLSAKNCIDILGLINSYDLGEKLVNSFAKADYEYRGEYGVSGRHYFSRKADPKVHLHIFKTGDLSAQKHLHYVQVMRCNPLLVEEFNRLKSAWQQQLTQLEYQHKKAYFYDKVAKLN